MSRTVTTGELAKQVDDAARAPFILDPQTAKELEVDRNEYAL